MCENGKVGLIGTSVSGKLLTIHKQIHEENTELCFLNKNTLRIFFNIIVDLRGGHGPGVV